MVGLIRPLVSIIRPLRSVRKVRVKNHRLGSWKGLDEVEHATLNWVDWFNNRRLLGPIEDIPPVEYENMYYQQAESAAA